MNDPGVQLHHDGPVATISLSRPDVLNAQTPQMWNALRQFGKEVRVVLKGQERPLFVFTAGDAGSGGPGGEYLRWQRGKQRAVLEYLMCGIGHCVILTDLFGFGNICYRIWRGILL